MDNYSEDNYPEDFGLALPSKFTQIVFKFDGSVSPTTIGVQLAAVVGWTGIRSFVGVGLPNPW